MIINHPVLNRFSPSIREISPETNDDKLIVPNTLQLSGLPCEPIFRTVAGSGNIQESSVMAERIITVANGGALLLELATLRQGYWEIDVFMAYRGNFVGVSNAGDARITIDLGSGSLTLLALYGQIEQGNSARRIKLMLQQTTVFSAFLGANGVGQEHMCVCSMIANKLL